MVSACVCVYVRELILGKKSLCAWKVLLCVEESVSGGGGGGVACVGKIKKGSGGGDGALWEGEVGSWGWEEKVGVEETCTAETTESV